MPPRRPVASRREVPGGLSCSASAPMQTVRKGLRVLLPWPPCRSACPGCPLTRSCGRGPSPPPRPRRCLEGRPPVLTLCPAEHMHRNTGQRRRGAGPGQGDPSVADGPEVRCHEERHPLRGLLPVSAQSSCGHRSGSALRPAQSRPGPSPGGGAQSPASWSVTRTVASPVLGL